MSRILNILFCLTSGYLVSSFRINLNRRGLFEIPVKEIDRGVTYLDMNTNDLQGLEDRIFEHHTQIHTLNFWTNKIVHVASEAFYGIQNLETLNLGRNKLSEIPNLRTVSDTLTSLTLRGNEITQLMPTTLRYSMSVLKQLDLRENKISHITIGYFGAFKTLDHLDLWRNLLTEFNPVKLNISKTLIYLGLAENDIKVLENGSFIGFVKLKRLNLNLNSLTEFDVGKLTGGQLMPNLVHLHLYGNQLTATPSTDLLPDNMQTLDVGRNQITYIPGDFFEIYKTLKTLSLDGMGIRTLPDFTTVMEYLEQLTLNNNGFTDLNITSTFLSNVPKLKGLNLQHNSLTSLHEGDNCKRNVIFTNVETLDFGWNSITFISDTYFCQTPKLKILKLNHNKVTTFDILTNLNHLSEVHLQANVITEFPNLGSAFGNVEILFLNHNALKNITLSSVYGTEKPNTTATSLVNLRLHNNPGLSVADDVWATMPKLERLYLYHSRLETFPNITAFTQLRLLHLHGNSLTEIKISDLSSLKQNTRLENVYLNYNRLTTLPNLLEVAAAISSVAVHFHVRGNNLECDVNMCWMKYLSLQ